mmetsp:Transcript_34050/g.54349  ORF Transcript_34050/g.54349 Transcript_34050/m.54349 type:complete len:99 (-) Transcript_34050:163-459(-)
MTQNAVVSSPRLGPRILVRVAVATLGQKYVAAFTHRNVRQVWILVLLVVESRSSVEEAKTPIMKRQVLVAFLWRSALGARFGETGFQALDQASHLHVM